MIDIKFLRENPEIVKENIRKKFQDEKLPLVDEAIRLDDEKRKAQMESEQLKAARNKLSKANGPLFGQLKKCEDEAKKAEIQAQIDANNAAVKADDELRAQLEAAQTEAAAKLQEIMDAYKKEGKSVYTPSFIEDNEDKVKALQESYEFTYTIEER